MLNEPNVRHEIAMAQDALMKALRNKNKNKAITDAINWLSLAQNKIVANDRINTSCDAGGSNNKMVANAFPSHE